MSAQRLKGVRHIIWDWNGTLLDDVQICLEIINSLLAEQDLKTVNIAEYREVFDFPVKDYYRRLGFDFSLEPFESISTRFITEYENRRSSCALMPGALLAIQDAHEADITQSILSASKKDYLDRAVQEYQLECYFLIVDGIADHHASGKFNLAKTHLESLPYPPGEILLVGDTLHDADIAGRLDLQCCLIPHGHHSRSKLSSANCRIEESISDLINSINR